MYLEVATFDTHEIVSPELALVDPELAHRERRRLPNPGELEAFVRISARLDPDPLAATPTVRFLATLQGFIRGREVRVVQVAVVPLLVAVVLLNIRAQLGDTPTPAVSAVEAPIGPSDGQPQGVAPLEPRAVPQPKAKTAPAPATDTEVASPPNASPAKTAIPPAKHSEPAPAGSQRFAWAPSKGANAYHVEFFRVGARVFVARTKQAAVEVPASWRYGGRTRRLTAGEYRWYVWPIVEGRRATTAVVQARLTIPSS